MSSTEPRITVLSLGGGVQSTAMAIMATSKHKMIKKPDCAIFADTGWEPESTHKTIEWLRGILDYPIHIARAEVRLRDVVRNNGKGNSNFLPIPSYSEKGMGRRQCTREYKITPIAGTVKRLCGIKGSWYERYGYVKMYLGISTDEAARMKDSHIPWISNSWPLIELNLSRKECLKFLRDFGYIGNDDTNSTSITKSTCIGCPFKGNAQWLKMKHIDPENFNAAVQDERAMNKTRAAVGQEPEYFHNSKTPLDTAVLNAEKSLHPAVAYILRNTNYVPVSYLLKEYCIEEKALYAIIRKSAHPIHKKTIAGVDYTYHSDMLDAHGVERSDDMMMNECEGMCGV